MAGRCARPSERVLLNAPDMSVGVELARARRVCGLSIEDISTRTNVTVGTLAAIENNQVDDIPTVEVRGALRAYAAEVQLDPEDVVHRYFAEFEASIDEFPSEATIATDIEYRDSIQPSDHRDASDVHPPVASDHIDIDRIDVSPALIDRIEYRARDRHRSRAAASVALIAAVAGFLLGEYSYRWRSASRTPDVASIQRNGNQQQNGAIERRADTDADVRTPGPGAAGQTPEPSRVRAPSMVTREPNTSANRAETRAASRSHNRTPNTTEGRPAASVNGTAEPPVQNLSGWWSVTNRIESTAYRPYENLNLGYRVRLTQKGDQINGSGRKWMENGRQLPPAQRTAIALSGTVEQGRVMLSFTEYGTRRTSVGSFAYDISDTGALQGSFSSDVAQSKGSSRAARISTRE